MIFMIALHQDEEGFSVSVPGLPGCWSQGDTEDEALANAYFTVTKRRGGMIYGYMPIPDSPPI